MAAVSGREAGSKCGDGKEKADRMAEIRKDRRQAGFTEVTVWVPEEDTRDIRDLAWDLVDEAEREFPHRATGGNARRERKRQ